MRKFSRLMGITLIFIMMFLAAAGTVSAKTWKFGSEGEGQNPFTPRGYLVDTDKGRHWLSSPFNNSGPVVRYSGVKNGVDYLEAKKSDGSDYTFYAMTDRNPWPKDSSYIGYNKLFLAAWKDGVRISNFNDYAKTPAARGDKVDPSGQGTCWQFTIEGFSLEPGSQYEFGFLRGMQANNGITLVLAEDEKGNTTGYIKEDGSGLSAEEKAQYNRQKYEEYEFISSWHEKENGKGYVVNRVPMRFSVQTYADLTKWEKAEKQARDFLGSVTEQDFRTGKYKRSNIKQLRLLLQDLNEKAEEEVKKMLQSPANKEISRMIRELNEMIRIAKSDKPEPADISKLEAKLKEARALYARAEGNVGVDVGQYGRIEVENLGEEIQRAKKMDRFTPQNEINDEVAALEAAIVEVKASRVQEEQKIFYDKVTGIYVITPVDALPEEAKLFVRRMGKESGDYRSIEKNLQKKETEAVFYRIQFYEGDVKIQPSKKAEVQMPIVDEISQKSSTVYAVDEKGSLSRVESVKVNGTQIFKTKKMSAFVMAGSTATEAEKAEARGKRMAAIMAQKKDKDADNKENRLEKDKKKKEVFRDPLNKLLKRQENTAVFSGDVRKETDPSYLIAVAVILAAAAVAMGVRALVQSREKRRKQ